MTELESGEPVVSEDVPTPTFKDEVSDSKVSIDSQALAKQVAELLRPDFEKIAQSTKDKRIAKLEKAVGGLAELEALGVAIPPEVKLEMRLRDLEQSSVSKPVSQGSGTVDANGWAKIIADVGLDTKDSETIALLRGEYRNLDHFEAAAFRLKKRLDSKPNPSLETSPSLNGRPLSAKPDRDQLAAELSELQNNPTKDNKERRAELVKELRATK